MKPNHITPKCPKCAVELHDDALTQEAHHKLVALLEEKNQALYSANQEIEAQRQRLLQAEAEIKEASNRLQDTEAELKRLAHYDPLTHLSNQLQFETDLKREIARAVRHNRKIAVLYLDIDYFKKVNDMFGHTVGDLLLTEVANRLRSLARTEDFLARLGGDEFAVLLTDIENAHQSAEVAKRILKGLNKPFHLDGFNLMIGVSIGIACYPEAGNEAGMLYRNADIALCSAKALGRNNYQFFTAALHVKHANRLELEAELHFALEREEFFLVYQPRIDLQTEKMVGMEVLVRWQHPMRGLISPMEFIPIAEETGLILPLGDWILKTACKQFVAWREQHKQWDCAIAVNVSPRQFQHKDFVAFVIRTLQEYNVPTHLLEFEITETATHSFFGRMEDSLAKLHSLGVQLSIDDFGTGYSTLTRLKELPIHSIKIDRSFVRDIDIKVSDNLIIKSTIKLAKDLGLNVIAEGVETESQLRFLIKNRCPQAQGYYYSQPLTVDEMTTFIETQKITSSSTG